MNKPRITAKDIQWNKHEFDTDNFTLPHPDDVVPNKISAVMKKDLDKYSVHFGKMHVFEGSEPKRKTWIVITAGKL